MCFGVKEFLTDRNIKKTTQPAKKNCNQQNIFGIFHF